MLVVSAGSLMHFLMAIVIFAIFAMAYGVPRDDGSWEVSSVSTASAAGDLGIEPGDEILSISGIEITEFEQFGEVVQARGGQTVDVVWERDGEVLGGTTDLRFRLTSSGAAAFEGLLAGDPSWPSTVLRSQPGIKSWPSLTVALAIIDITIDPVEFEPV